MILSMIIKVNRARLLQHVFYPRLSHIRRVTYDLHRLDSGPATNVELTKEDALNYYKNMQLIRKMENAIGGQFQKKRVRGFVHLYVGQEACCVGIKAVIRPEDTAITSYRCHAWTLMMGQNVKETMKRIFAELLGKKSGTSRGKAGSMHLFERNFYGGQAIVGSYIPIGTGLALGHKYKEDGGINFAMMGDGATNQGQVHEAFNMAKLLNLPIIYVVENNRYGMGTEIFRSSSNTDYYKVGDLIPGIRLDGMDVIVVREAAKYAVEHVKRGKGPILLELTTYRYFGHSMSDPGTTYRKREEIEQMRKERDAIKNLSEKILSSNLATIEELSALEAEAKAMVEEALTFAKNDSPVSADELTSDVYKNYKGKIKMPQAQTYRMHKNIQVGPEPSPKPKPKSIEKKRMSESKMNEVHV